MEYSHRIAILKISFFDNFLSGGWVGTNFLSSANAPLTFCCLHLSLLLVNIFFTTPLVGVSTGVCMSKITFYWNTVLIFEKCSVPGP